MTTTKDVASEFRQGDEVVLAEGEFQGTLGTFLRLKQDPKWADITERNGSVRSHPVKWLTHSTSATPGRDN
jgi:transcription antitermination factor NusG